MQRSIPILLSFLILFLAGGFAGCDSEGAEVTALDESYDVSLDARDGAKAVTYLSKDSIKRLDRMVDLARKARKSEVKALPYADRYEVLRIRLLFPSDELKKIDGRTYYSRLVSAGWVSSTSDCKRVKVSVNGAKTQASITYRAPGSPDTFRSFWVFEDGGWREDDIAQADEDTQTSAADAKNAGMSVDEYIFYQLEEASSKEIPDSIWDPSR